MLAQEEQPGLDQLGFLLGRWVGLRSGDAVEEVWTRPTAMAMMGMFCWSREHKPQLFEFLVIEARPAGLALELRAFSPAPGLPPHAARPLRWQLARWANNEVAFEAREDGQMTRITYRREREDRLYSTLERYENGRNRIYPYHYNSVELRPVATAGTS